MRIISAASAFPKHYYKQEVMMAALRGYWNGQLENPEFFTRLHARTCVDGRHLALPLEAYYGLDTWGKQNKAWYQAAEDLGSRALCGALSRAGLSATDISALFFVSVTGVASPIEISGST